MFSLKRPGFLHHRYFDINLTIPFYLKKNFIGRFCMLPLTRQKYTRENRLLKEPALSLFFLLVAALTILEQRRG
jgi:hypothetical protein